MGGLERRGLEVKARFSGGPVRFSEADRTRVTVPAHAKHQTHKGNEWDCVKLTVKALLGWSMGGLCCVPEEGWWKVVMQLCPRPMNAVSNPDVLERVLGSFRTLEIVTKRHRQAHEADCC